MEKMDTNNPEDVRKWALEQAMKNSQSSSLDDDDDDDRPKTFNPKLTDYDRDALWKESYYFNDFINYWTHPSHRFVGFKYQKIMRTKLVPEMLKVIRIINKGGERYTIVKVEQTSSDVDPIEIVDEGKFRSLYNNPAKGCYIKCANRTEKGNSAKDDRIPLFDPIYNYAELFGYIDMDFVPFNPRKNPKIHPKVFNTFTRFGAREVNQVNMELIQPILNHIKRCLAKDDPIRDKWINDWFAKSVQDPTAMIPVLVLFGSEGAGKSMIIQFILDYVWGGHCTRYLTSLQDVTGQFNSIIAHRYGICLAEAEAQDQRSTNVWTMMNKLNPLVTDKKTAISTKYLSTYMEKNYRKWIILTNHLESLRASMKQRRLAVFDVSDIFLGNSKYFKDLAALIDDRDGDVEKVQEIANHLFTYWLNLEITTDFNKILETEAVSEVKQLSLPNPVLFWYAIHQYCWIPTKLSKSIHGRSLTKYDGVLFLTKQDLHFLYQQWCHDCGHMSQPDNIFYRLIKSNGITINDYQDGKDGKHYVVLPAPVVNHILQTPASNYLSPDTPSTSESNPEAVKHLATHLFGLFPTKDHKYDIPKICDMINNLGARGFLFYDDIRQLLPFATEDIDKIKTFCDANKIVWFVPLSF